MKTLDRIAQYTLSSAEIDEIVGYSRMLCDEPIPPTDPRFCDKHWDLHLHLPEGVRRFLEWFRRTEAAAACLVKGFPVPEDQVGLTPPTWEEALLDRPVLNHDIFIAMCGLALGDPFTWSTLQNASMIQNIVPIRGDERRQNGHSSEVLLEFHTEDGFHPARCDYLMLFGVRNNDEVPTYLASIGDVELSDAVRSVLSQPRFHIFPDDEHVRQLQRRHPDHPALARALELQRAPEAVAVLFGDRLNPYLRIDRPFMRCAEGDVEAERALDALMAELKRHQQSVVVERGTLLVVDNYRAVHGRKAFRSRYDGSDRWLKRMIVSRNLRKAEGDRGPSSYRVLF
ncbi:guanitoxin biosynthesis L-enduracididine beta-hydroxylase GntD [Micromonospora aurantiaca]|uniref:Taurine catabolism dioxygenase TauD n=1 Tax=Micromonospora aurantiaca (nom. illeg.) TaxID=47850 RepID=A0A3M9JWE3_9ACTN|nr:guanitoxin biosynthesis L-enduracididine beta-hydroxylase GntD [Micromonospora aurantiaca]ADL45379.1 Taurine catabolism dioxygenase TauD/TfdA [Micromonospora aurantiaca ATCC 27029]AXH91491.1 taurine catabolism dioxygenase TauD [Micromonospora aurantiaca]RNH93060.1 taurine catabolism dioxygenase TauD [Micromonospora aurantiaca]